MTIDDYRLFEEPTDDGTPIDPEVALATAYVARELSAMQMVAVERRVATDAAFATVFRSVADAWAVPLPRWSTELADTNSALVAPPTRQELDAGWRRFVDRERAADGGRPIPQRKPSMIRIAAVVTLTVLPLLTFAQLAVYTANHEGAPLHKRAQAIVPRVLQEQVRRAPQVIPEREIEGPTRGTLTTQPRLRTEASLTPVVSSPAATSPVVPSTVAPVAHTVPDTTPVRPLPGNRPPDYPAALRQANLEGTVLAQFVVDTTGLVDVNTFRAASSSDPAFTTSVRAQVETMRFTPASIDGRKVKQLVRLEYAFTLNGPARSNAWVCSTGCSVLQVKERSWQAASTRGAPIGAMQSRAGIDRAMVMPWQVDRITSSSMPRTASARSLPASTAATDVSPLPGNQPPAYPEALRAARVNGQVLVEFVVDARGIPDTSRAGFLEQSDPRFASAVHDAMPEWRFRPAVGSDGRPIEQLAEMLVIFTVAKP